MLETEKLHIQDHRAQLRMERPGGSDSPEHPGRSCGAPIPVDDHLLSPGASSASFLVSVVFIRDAVAWEMPAAKYGCHLLVSFVSLRSAEVVESPNHLVVCVTCTMLPYHDIRH